MPKACGELTEALGTADVKTAQQQTCAVVKPLVSQSSQLGKGVQQVDAFTPGLNQQRQATANAGHRLKGKQLTGVHGDSSAQARTACGADPTGCRRSTIRSSSRDSWALMKKWPPRTFPGRSPRWFRPARRSGTGPINGPA